MRFALRELLIVVTVAALAAGAFAKGDSWTVDAFESLTYLTIVAAILLAIGRTARARQFWLGMAIVAGLYCYFAIGPDEYGNSPRRTGATSRALVKLISGLHGIDPEFITSGGGLGGGMGGGMGGMTGVFSVIDTLGSNLILTTSNESNFDFAESTKQGATTDDPFAGEGDLQPAADSDSLTIPNQNSSLSIQIGRGQQLVTADWNVIDAQFRIGHCSVALLLGWLGGHFLAFVWERSRVTAERK